MAEAKEGKHPIPFVIGDEGDSAPNNINSKKRKHINNQVSQKRSKLGVSNSRETHPHGAQRFVDFFDALSDSSSHKLIEKCLRNKSRLNYAGKSYRDPAYPECRLLRFSTKTRTNTKKDKGAERRQIPKPIVKWLQKDKPRESRNFEPVTSTRKSGHENIVKKPITWYEAYLHNVLPDMVINAYLSRTTLDLTFSYFLVGARVGKV